MPKTTKLEAQILTGWSNIAKFLGQSVAVAQRWANDGTPVQLKGRSMTASPEQLSKWLGWESGAREPMHITQPEDDDLLKDLRSGLKEAHTAKRK
jgi:hypothetical protein